MPPLHPIQQLRAGGWQAVPKGQYHYPLNIQENRRVEFTEFTRHLKASRKKYKQRHL